MAIIILDSAITVTTTAADSVVQVALEVVNQAKCIMEGLVTNTAAIRDLGLWDLGEWDLEETLEAGSRDFMAGLMAAAWEVDLLEVGWEADPADDGRSFAASDVSSSCERRSDYVW